MLKILGICTLQNLKPSKSPNLNFSIAIRLNAVRITKKYIDNAD